MRRKPDPTGERFRSGEMDYEPDCWKVAAHHFEKKVMRYFQRSVVDWYSDRMEERESCHCLVVVENGFELLLVIACTTVCGGGLSSKVGQSFIQQAHYLLPLNFIN